MGGYVEKCVFRKTLERPNQTTLEEHHISTPKLRLIRFDYVQMLREMIAVVATVQVSLGENHIPIQVHLYPIRLQGKKVRRT